ncbi:MAG: LuxR C-terminal-related transcriptional regulator [Candidatus Dormibacteria bacterium]
MARVAGDEVETGFLALNRGDWVAATEAFETAVARDETPDALDGLGQARWWAYDLAASIDLRTRAYAAYIDEGRHANAVRCASWLAREYFTVHGNLPAAGGWISRADAQLEKAGPCAAAGWLALIKAAMITDTTLMKQLASSAIDAGDRFGDYDLEIVGMSMLGIAEVYACEVGAGMARIDAAMAAAIGGELSSFWALSDVYCNTLLACERAGDFERAEQWCRVVNEFAKRYEAMPLFPFCHVTYGTMLSATGRWAEAEAALVRAVEMFNTGHRALGVIAISRLAELKLKQGYLEAAQQLLLGYEDHLFALRPVVRIRLAEGRTAVAARMLQSRLEQVGRVSLLAAPLLALLVEVQLAIGNRDAAHETALQLADIGAMSGQRNIVAAAEHALGAATLTSDASTAAHHLDRAALLFHELELPYETGRARLLVGRARAASDREVAVADVRTALAVFERIGARRDVDEAAALLRDLGDPGPRGPKGWAVLTRREREVLRLLAGGVSNAEIGSRLFISPKTAEHHVGRVLDKLELRGRAEAAAYAIAHPELLSAEK